MSFHGCSRRAVKLAEIGPSALPLGPPESDRPTSSQCVANLLRTAGNGANCPEQPPANTVHGRRQPSSCGRRVGSMCCAAAKAFDLWCRARPPLAQPDCPSVNTELFFGTIGSRRRVRFSGFIKPAGQTCSGARAGGTGRAQCTARRKRTACRRRIAQRRRGGFMTPPRVLGGPFSAASGAASGRGSAADWPSQKKPARAR
jgi:hypothetical protein